jgi:hypothetical protein
MRFVIGSEKMQEIAKHDAWQIGFCLAARRICLVMPGNSRNKTRRADFSRQNAQYRDS